MSDTNEREQLFTIKKEDYNQLYKLADAITSTKPEKTHEYVMAKALQERLDIAIDDDEAFVIFSEKEVEMLAEVV